MNCCVILRSLLLVLLGQFPLIGQTNDFVAKVSDTVISLDQATYDLRIEFQVIPGFHIQSNDPGNENVIPTSVNLELPPGLELVSVEFPESSHIKLEGSERPLEVLDGRFEVIVALKCTRYYPDASRVNGTLRYQACDDKRCFYPRELRFEVKWPLQR